MKFDATALHRQFDIVRWHIQVSETMHSLVRILLLIWHTKRCKLRGTFHCAHVQFNDMINVLSKLSLIRKYGKTMIKGDSKLNYRNLTFRELNRTHSKSLLGSVVDF